MPGTITYAAVALLARDRLGQIRRALAAKGAAGAGGSLGELGRHVLYLVTEAERMMADTQPVIEPPVRMYGPPLTARVSRFFLLGAVGPDLARYAAAFAPGQRWLFDTLHKGTPDEHRERVLARSTDLVFDFWRRVGPLVEAEFSDQPKRDAARRQMQAYALGHLCHVAADVLAHPYFEGVEARLSEPAVAAPPPPRPAVPFLTRDGVAGALDVRVSSQFFGRGFDTTTSQWADWFPPPGDVPKAFARAMAASITALYGARAQGLPAFEEAFAKIDPQPPALDEALIAESVESFRSVVEMQRVWTLPRWMGATAAMALPMIFAYPLALALPQAKNLTRALTPADGEGAEAQRTYELVTFPLAMGALGPLVTMIIVSASGRGLRAEGVLGWVHAGVSLAASVGFFATLGGAGAARWTLLFALPLALAVVQFFVAAIRGGSENARKLLWLGPVWQIGLWALFLLLYKTWLHEGVEEWQKPAAERNDGKAWGYFLAWLGIVGTLWFVHAVLWRWVFSGSLPDDQNTFAAGEPRQFARVYDDPALVHDAGAPADSERLGDLSYPPARRPLLALWWQAGTKANLQIRADRDRLTFHWPDAPSPPDHVVFAPAGPVTVRRFGELLAAAVTGDATLGTLHVKPARADEADLELAPGSPFSDHGDTKTDLATHDADAATFLAVGAAEAAAFTLFHAPRPRLAVRVGRSGVTPEERRPLQTPAEDAARAGSLLLPAAAATPRRHTVSPPTAGGSPLLRALLRPGDVLEIASAGPFPAAGEQRVVEAVVGDTDVIVASPFASAIPAAGIAYRRSASDRSVRLRVATTVRVPAPAVGVGPNDVQAVIPGARFGAELRVGDVVELVSGVAGAAPVARRTVTAVRDRAPVGLPPAPADLLELDAPPPAFAGALFVERVTDAEADGLAFLADASDVFGDGGSVMNDAADLAALLCLGAASRLQPNGAPPVPPGGTKPVHRVSQVFRNWNLDRRRLNEWRTIVGGGAASERRGDFRAAEEAAPVDPADAGAPVSDATVAMRRTAEALVREQGWLGVFRGWVDMAARARTDVGSAEVFRAGAPSNRELSRAMAYLIDAGEGVAP